MQRNDVEAGDFAAFLSWPPRGRLRPTCRAMGAASAGGRRFWFIWPMLEAVDEVRRVVHVDGIYPARNVAVLIACSEYRVLSWHLTRRDDEGMATPASSHGPSPYRRGRTFGGSSCARSDREFEASP